MSAQSIERQPRHTPGPWRVEPSYQGGYRIESANPHLSATVADTYARYGSVQGDADARLIAAAPEILRALIELHDAALMVESVVHGYAASAMSADLSSKMAAARAVIAKAEGRS